MSVDPDIVKEELRSGGEEYHYRDDNCDIGGNKSGESSIHVEHFVVKKDKRRQNIATDVLTALFDVMREEHMTSLTIKMGATVCTELEDLEDKRDEHGESWQDPTYDFLFAHGFRNLSYEGDWQWNLCVTGFKSI